LLMLHKSFVLLILGPHVAWTLSLHTLSCLSFAQLFDNFICRNFTKILHYPLARSVILLILINFRLYFFLLPLWNIQDGIFI
jgi:hypothetical protein